jgi:hypothetical protein
MRKELPHELGIVLRPNVRENRVCSRGKSVLFHRALAGRFPIALNAKCPRGRIARGKSSHQVTVNLVLAYLPDIRLNSPPFEPAFVLRHILRRNALTFLLWE